MEMAKYHSFYVSYTFDHIASEVYVKIIQSRNSQFSEIFSLNENLLRDTCVGCVGDTPTYVFCHKNTFFANVSAMCLTWKKHYWTFTFYGCLLQVLNTPEMCISLWYLDLLTRNTRVKMVCFAILRRNTPFSHVCFSSMDLHIKDIDIHPMCLCIEHTRSEIISRFKLLFIYFQLVKVEKSGKFPTHVSENTSHVSENTPGSAHQCVMGNTYAHWDFSSRFENTRLTWCDRTCKKHENWGILPSPLTLRTRALLSHNIVRVRMIWEPHIIVSKKKKRWDNIIMMCDGYYYYNLSIPINRSSSIIIVVLTIVHIHNIISHFIIIKKKMICGSKFHWI